MNESWQDFLELNTSASAKDLKSDVWDNDNGCCYSSDGLRLLDAENYPQTVHVKDGTEVICDDVFSFQDYMDEDRKIGETIPEDERIAFLDKIFLPESLTHIGKRSFKECGWMKSIKLTKNLRVIGESAFESCDDLKSVACPASLVAIDSGAFSDCYSITNLRLNKGLKAIGAGAFYYCEGIEEIVLPPSLEYIGEDAFTGTSLKKIFVAPSARESLTALLPAQLHRKIRNI